MVTRAVEECLRGLSLGDPQELSEIFGAHMKGMLAQYADRKAILDCAKSRAALFNYPLSSMCGYHTHELE